MQFIYHMDPNIYGLGIDETQRAQKVKQCEFSWVYSYSHLKDSHASTFFYLYLRDNLSRRQISKFMEWKKKQTLKTSHQKTMTSKTKSGIKTHMRVRWWKKKMEKQHLKLFGERGSSYMTTVVMCFLCFCFRAGTLAEEHTASPSDYSLSALQEPECRRTNSTRVLGVHQTCRLEPNWSEWWRDRKRETIWQERGGWFTPFKPDWSCCFLACRW